MYLILAKIIAIIVLITNVVYADKLLIEKCDRYFNDDIVFFNQEGKKIYLEHYEGTNILLVFWAAWCSNCVSELYALDNLQKDFRKLPFKILVISEDNTELSLIQKYFNQQNIRNLELFKDDKNQLFRSLNIVGLPTAFFINSNGKNKLLFRGDIKWYNNQVRRQILSEIDENLEMPNNSYKSVDLNRNVIIPDMKNFESPEKVVDNTAERPSSAKSHSSGEKDNKSKQ